MGISGTKTEFLYFGVVSSPAPIRAICNRSSALGEVRATTIARPPTRDRRGTATTDVISQLIKIDDEVAAVLRDSHLQIRASRRPFSKAIFMGASLRGQFTGTDRPWMPLAM